MGRSKNMAASLEALISATSHTAEVAIVRGAGFVCMLKDASIASAKIEGVDEEGVAVADAIALGGAAVFAAMIVPEKVDLLIKHGSQGTGDALFGIASLGLAEARKMNRASGVMDALVAAVRATPKGSAQTAAMDKVLAEVTRQATSDCSFDAAIEELAGLAETLTADALIASARDDSRDGAKSRHPSSGGEGRA